MSTPVYEAQLIPRAGAGVGIGTWSVVRSRDNSAVLESPFWDYDAAQRIAQRLNVAHDEGLAEGGAGAELADALEALLRDGFSGDDVRLLAVGFAGSGVTKELHEHCDRLTAATARAREALRRAGRLP